MARGFSFFVVAFITANLFGQQDKQLTHYMFDKMSYNPAATGFKGYCATVIYRNQWDRVERAPNTTLFNIQANLPSQNLGIGLSMSNDAIGFQRINNLVINGAYHFSTNLGILSGGIGIGLINIGFSPDWVPPQTYQDPNLPTPIASTGLDMNFGLHWHGSNQPYYVGLSSTHVAQPSLNNINYQVARHYYFLAGYNFQIPSKTEFVIRPSFLLKSDGATSIFDLNTTVDFWLNYYSYLWGGISYRLKDAIAINVGYAFSPSGRVKSNMMKIGYSFDIMTNPLNTYGRGTHELMFNMCIFRESPVISRHGNPWILL